MQNQFTNLFKKGTLQLLVISMVVGLLTPIKNVSALEDQTQQETPTKTEVIILGEDESLREESSKTFILSDKTKQKIIYSIPIHYDDNGEWKEIDNTFIDDGLTYEDESVIEETIEIEETNHLIINDFDIQGNILNEETELEEIDSKETTDTSISDENDVVEGAIDTTKLVNDTENTANNLGQTEESVVEADTNTSLNERTTINQEETTIEIEENINQEEIEEVETVERADNTDKSQVMGYKNKNGQFDIKFSKKVHTKNMVSIADGDYKVTWGFADYKNKSLGKFSSSSAFDNPIESAYNNIAQQINYSSVIDGIDLVYQIDSLQIKENIIINKPTTINEFTFEYKVNKLELFLNDVGEIEARNEAGDIIFLMPKPYMYDSNGLYSDNVHYEISQKNKKYSITIVADEEWMNNEERAYPVVIDPVIQSQQTATAIDSTFIASDTDYDDTNFDTHFELLVGRESSAYHNCRSLFKFNLPTLNRGDMVVDANFYVAQYAHSFYTSTTADLQINAHIINNSWTDTTVTWNSIKGSGNPDSYYDNTILDYDFIKKTDKQNVANWKVFNITSAVKSWYNGTANNGILLKSHNESGGHEEVGVKGSFWPEDYNNTYNAFPYIAISYRNNKGIESYWDYTSFSTYSAGDVYIDNYSGNLVVSHLDASTYGSRAPINISHIYNGYMSTKNVSNIQPYVGYGWKLNIQQTLRPSSVYGLTGTSATTYPYVYMDGDGTEHYFIKKDSQYLDEDGLGLELKVITGGYTITDKKDNVMTFNSSGNITKITDANGNNITYTYSGNIITKVTSGNGQALTLSYDSNGYLTKITDQANRVTTFVYSNNLLTKITNSDGTTSSYTYDSNSALQTMTSCDGTTITFSYTSLASGKKVSQVVEKGSDGSLGQTLKFDRSQYNTTIITTSGIDSVINTTDDVKTELQFDDAGRLTTRRVYTDEKDLGAEVFEFTAATTNEDKSNIQSLNRLSKVGSLGANIMDLAINTSGDSTDVWTSSSSIANTEFTFGTTTEESLFGNSSFKLTATSCELSGRSRFYQNHNSPFAKASTTYTASGYIKTENITPVEGATDYGAAILIYIDAPSMPIDEDPEAADFVSEYIVGTTDEEVNNGWRRVSVTFTTPADIATIRFNCMIRNATGTAYFDGLQLEQSEVANPNNLLVNACFERTTSKFPRYWEKSGMESTDIADTTIKHSGDRSIKITSSVSQQKYMYQTVNVVGSEEDSYILSGWSYGKGIEKNDDSTKYELIPKVTYSDGTSVWKDPLKFNTSVSGWKYVSKIFDLSDGTSAIKTPTSITVYARSYGQPNTLYFDNVQLIESEVAACEYDDEGNMVSSDGSTYDYSNGDLIKVTDKEGKVTTYTYNDYHQKTSSTSPNGIKNTTGYDTYGNILSNTITNSSTSQSIKTETTYDSTNSFVSTTKDEDGRSTSYAYLATYGLLDKITDPKGNILDYSYNTKQLLSAMTSGDSTVEYVYDSSNRLTEIHTSTDTYYLTYDVFGNRKTTSINAQLLSTFTYQANNGYLQQTQYSNGYTESYEYDEYGNIVTVKINDVVAQENQYDSMGTLVRTKDYRINQEYVYDYDKEGRLIRTTIFDMTLGQLSDRSIYEISWGYDDKDRIIYESVYENGVTNVQHYTYSDKDLLSQIQLDTTTKLKYNYDAFERVSSKVIDTTSTDITTSYTYATSQRGSTYTTTKIATETIGDTTYTYTYDEIGNITQITITRGSTTQTIQYEYDENSQLVRENNGQLNKTIVYTYDTAGNLLTKEEYAYTTGSTLGTATDTIEYEYISNTQPSRLTSYNGKFITYDVLGNSTEYYNSRITWEGRNCLSVENKNGKVYYTYDSDGMRKTKKTGSNTTTYDYVGTQLVHEDRDDYELCYSYDSSGNLAKISHVESGVTTNYYVATNFRGDVEAIYNTNGTLQARYIYDSWGVVVNILDANGNEITDENHIGQINPIRYRGYYYDTETGFYYLQSRYYDPVVGRFISADFQLNSDILGNNLYIYCGNNPVNNEDDEGTSWTALVALKIAFDIICDITVTAMIKEASGESYTSSDLITTVIGSIGTTFTPVDEYAALISGSLELINCLAQKEDFKTTAISTIVATVGTGFTVNTIHNHYYDDFSKPIEILNDLTFGSGEYLTLTGIEQWLTSDWKISKNKNVASAPSSSGVLIHFSKTNKNRTRFGNGRR